MKSIIIILSGLFIVCSSPIYSSDKPKTNIPLEVSSLKQLDRLLGSQKIVFIDFYKDSCPPCEQFKPLYESWVRLFDKQIIFIKINASNPKTDELCKKFKITSLPTLIVLDSQGEEIAKHIGLEEIKKINIKKFLVYVED